ncbi:MAG: autotransporter-associated beta strand repeat-containing protein [Opitutae bacterium]|nr:autotransporter-associated beta strand repeat-containing protein [Opitutae bacterium]
MNLRAKVGLLLALVFSLTPHVATATSGATPYVWTGLGTDSVFTTPANWLTNTAPTNDGTANILFEGAPKNFITFASAANLATLTFGGFNDVFFTAPTPTTLTLQQGLMQLQPGTYTSFGANLTLAIAANQTWTVAGSLQVSGALSGAGTLTLISSGPYTYTYLHASSPSFTGGIVLNSGNSLYLGQSDSLGTGRLTINGGTLGINSVSPLNIPNPVTVAGNFSISNNSLSSPLTLSGPVTLAQSANIFAYGYYSFGSGIKNVIQFTGAIGESTTGNTLSFDAPYTLLRLSGANTYTGGTTVTSGSLVFDNNAALPGAGLLKTSSGGYIGTAVNTTGQVASFLAKFDLVNTTGGLGFDSPVGAVTPQIYSEPVNLTGFNSGVRLGSATSAILSSTAIITPAGTDYRFGTGGGTLTVQSALTGARQVDLTGYASTPYPFALVLQGTNTYTGGTTVYNNNVVRFDSATALPATGQLTAMMGGYIGITENAGLTANAFIARFNTTSNGGTVGFDSVNPASPRTISEAINLSSFSGITYLGTSTGVILTGTLTAPAGKPLGLTGVAGANLTVNSTLTTGSVAIGSSESSSPSSGVVTLNSANTYTGGTTFNDGRLILGNASALGTGAFTLHYFGNKTLTTNQPGLTIANAFTFLPVPYMEMPHYFPSLRLDTGGNDFTLSGVISGPGMLRKTNPGTLTLSGTNTFTGGITVENGTLALGSNRAAGTGPLDLFYGTTANALTSAPVLGGLFGNGTLNLASGSTLTFEQSKDTEFYGNITGAAALVKQGSGVLELSNANTYSGGTTILAGGLMADHPSALGTGTVTVNAPNDGGLGVAQGVTLTNPLVLTRGILTGTGTFAPTGGVTVGANIAIWPGKPDDISSIGAINFNSLTLASGGRLKWEIQDVNTPPGQGYDVVKVTGTLNVSATSGTPFVVSPVAGGHSGAFREPYGFNAYQPYSWTIASAGSITGFSTSNVTLDQPYLASFSHFGGLTLAQSGTSLLLNYTPAPMPTLWSGRGPNGNWSNAANWWGNTVPPGTNLANVVFGPASNTNVVIDSNRMVGRMRFEPAGEKGYAFSSTGGSTLTLMGGGLIINSPVASIAAASDSAHPVAAGGMYYGETQVKFDSTLGVVLGANQTWYLDGSLKILGMVSGTGQLTLSSSYHNGRLDLLGANTYSGGTIMSDSTVFIGSNSAFGTGPLLLGAGSTTTTLGTLNGPRSLANATTLEGTLEVNAPNSSLTFSGPVTLNDSVNFNLYRGALYITGNVSEANGGSSITVTGTSPLVLQGTANTYSGGTIANNGGVIFGSTGSIPAAGPLAATGYGYIGLATVPPLPTDIQTQYLNRFDRTNTYGTIGFDTDPAASSANIFTGAIDLSGFASSVRLGSATRAEISGTINPQSLATGYRFGNGGGTLTVSSKLTGNNGVTADSNGAMPLTVRLTNATNDYTGGTTANNSAILFGPGALPGTGLLLMGQGGYIGSFDTSLSASTFINRFTASLTQGIIGFDSPDATNRTLSDPLDLSRFNIATSPSIYLGTSTSVTLTGAITLPPTQTAYRFASYKGGFLDIASTLSGTRGVIIGDPDSRATSDTNGQLPLPSIVRLSGANTFTGSITLYNGRLEVTQAASLGNAANTLYVSGPYVDTSLPPGLASTTANLSLSQSIQLDHTLSIGGTQPFTLAGNISGYSGLQKNGAFALTLSGNNTFLGNLQINEGSVNLTGNNSAGQGLLAFSVPVSGNPSASFTTASPVVYGLQSDTANATINLAAGSTLTIAGYYDTIFRGTITGSGASLLKNNSGTLRLEGANTYSGGTTISNGQIVAGNAAALGTGPITLNGGRLGLDPGLTLANAIGFGASGGVLAGNGTIGGAVTLGQASGVAPGFSVGQINFNSTLTWGSGAYFLFEVQNPFGAPGSGYDTINVTGQLSLTATAGQPFTLNLISLGADGNPGPISVDFATTYQWQLASAGSITGFNASAINLDTSNFTALDFGGGLVGPTKGGSFSLTTSLDNTKLYLNFTPVPEPSTWLLLLGGASAVLFPALRRRRR